VRVPLHEVLEALLVLENGAKTAETDPLESVITILDQIKKDLDAFDIEEVQLGALVAIDGVLETIKSGQDESCRVA